MKPPEIALQAGQGLFQYGFYWLLRFSSIKDAAFCQRLAEQDFTFEMKVKDTSVRRFFSVKDGKVRSGLFGGEPQFSLVWATAADGNRVMADIMAAKPKVIMKAVMAGQLLLEGEASLVGRFLETLNMMNKIYRKKKVKRDK